MVTFKKLKKEYKNSYEFVEGTRENYPSMCFAGTSCISNAKELSNFSEYLDAAIEAGDVDSDIIPYLKRLNASGRVITVFSCWGHRESYASSYEDGNLLFRSSLDYNTIFGKILFPLVTKYHYVMPNFNVSLHAWEVKSQTATKAFYGYSITGLPITQAAKHELFDYLCSLVDNIK